MYRGGSPLKVCHIKKTIKEIKTLKIEVTQGTQGSCELLGICAPGASCQKLNAKMPSRHFTYSQEDC